MIIKDAMVVIHLAKVTLLESSCEYFNKVLIPREIYDEIIVYNEEDFIDVRIIKKLIDTGKIHIKQIENKELLTKAMELNIQRGEVEAVALYWQEKADYLATDDDNVRKKSKVLNIRIIGTPVIMLNLYKKKMINETKFKESVNELRKIGWFSNAVIDKILMEVK